MRPVLVSPEDREWEAAQPVVGSPSLSRLAGELIRVGFEPLKVSLGNDGESVTFSLRCNHEEARSVKDREDALRTLIRAFRLAGFNMGFTELAIGTFNGESLSGSTFVGPLEQGS